MNDIFIAKKTHLATMLPDSKEDFYVDVDEKGGIAVECECFGSILSPKDAEAAATVLMKAVEIGAKIQGKLVEQELAAGNAGLHKKQKK